MVIRYGIYLYLFKNQERLGLFRWCVIGSFFEANKSLSSIAITPIIAIKFGAEYIELISS